MTQLMFFSSSLLLSSLELSDTKVYEPQTRAQLMSSTPHSGLRRSVQLYSLGSGRAHCTCSQAWSVFCLRHGLYFSQAWYCFFSQAWSWARTLYLFSGMPASGHACDLSHTYHANRTSIKRARTLYLFSGLVCYLFSGMVSHCICFQAWSHIVFVLRHGLTLYLFSGMVCCSFPLGVHLSGNRVGAFTCFRV